MRVRKFRTIPCKPIVCPQGCKKDCTFKKGLERCCECTCPKGKKVGQEKKAPIYLNGRAHSRN